RIVDYIADAFTKEHGLDPRSDAEDCAQLWLDAETLKKSLSERNSITTVCHHNGLRSRVELTRKTFENMTSDLLSRTEITTELVRKQANLEWADLDHIIMVGGSSRMPMVTDLLLRLTGKNLDRSASPDQAIAHGAAIYAALLSDSTHKSDQILVTDVNSHSLGVIGVHAETGEKRVACMIPKNTPIPSTLKKSFKTATLGQSSVVVEVVEGESANPDNCIKIGQCIVSDLPSDLPAGSVIELSFSYEKDGTLEVSARLPSARRSVHTQIKRELQSDPLRFDHWVSLLTGNEPTTDSTSPDNTERSNNQGATKTPYELLDDTYFTIGSSAAGNSLIKGVPQLLVKQVEAYQREIIFLKDKLSEYNNRSAGGSVQRVQISTSIAKIKNRMESTEKKLQIAVIDLGKQCFQDDVELIDADSLYDKCEQLLKQTKI
ncbi:MAG TPA: hypothetical protein EYQ00_14280, partial [Dehalococcoidia bacterium]|nr:hypothetical protein [Dehalococcoidia bacterium]